MQNSDVITVVWDTGGLLTMITIVLVSFSLAAAWMGRYGGPAGRGRTRGRWSAPWCRS